jgi:CubicO group peptidase (beta-lactamase class C family)
MIRVCRNRVRLAGVYAGIFLVFTMCAPRSTRTVGSTYNFTAIDKKIQSWVDGGYYDGASIQVVKDGQSIHERYFGTYTAHTEVYIASAGKWLAAATIAAVVDAGKLSWNDRVEKWLPEFTDIKGQATLTQLLSHTAGYPDYQPAAEHRDDYQSLEEAVRHIVNLPADTTPGTIFRYGGLAMQVAGRMAEVATGKSWEQIFQEKIAIPLQMHYTHFTPVDTTAGHNPMLGGGARCTLHDYMNFLEMIAGEGVYKGKRILARETIAVMQEDHLKKAHIPADQFVARARKQKHTGIYGLGEWREQLNDRGEAMLLSSPGWAGAYPWIDKENNVYGLFLAHVNVERANRDTFSSFYASPVLPMMVRDIIKARQN